MSPNHFDNQKKKFAAGKSQQKLNDNQKQNWKSSINIR